MGTSQKDIRLVASLAVANVVANVVKFAFSSNGSSVGAHRAAAGNLHQLIVNEVITGFAIILWTGVGYLIAARRAEITVVGFRMICVGWIAIGVLSSAAAIPEYRNHLTGQSLVGLIITTLVLVVVLNVVLFTSVKASPAGLRIDRAGRLYKFMHPSDSPSSKDLRE